MPKIKMLKKAVGCPDGITSTEYKQGESYEVSEVLANCFVDMEVAEICEEDKADKAKMESPQNKANQKSPKNKTAL
jgi:hypothetical protein